LKNREPVSLRLEITNDTDKPQIISYEVTLASELSFEKQGLKSYESDRIESMKPGDKISKYYKIYPKVMARQGEYPITISVTEHYNSFNYVLGKKTKRLGLIVE
jgi:uncharacterized membrane protein